MPNNVRPSRDLWASESQPTGFINQNTFQHEAGWTPQQTAMQSGGSSMQKPELKRAPTVRAGGRHPHQSQAFLDSYGERRNVLRHNEAVMDWGKMQAQLSTQERGQDVQADSSQKDRDSREAMFSAGLKWDQERFGSEQKWAEILRRDSRDDADFTRKMTLLEKMFSAGSGGGTRGSGTSGAGGSGGTNITGANLKDFVQMRLENPELADNDTFDEIIGSTFEMVNRNAGVDLAGMDSNTQMQWLEAANSIGVLDDILRGGSGSGHAGLPGQAATRPATDWGSMVDRQFQGGGMEGSRFFTPGGGYAGPGEMSQQSIVPVTREDGSVVYTNRYDHYGVDAPAGTPESKEQKQRKASAAAQGHEDRKLEEKKGPAGQNTPPAGSSPPNSHDSFWMNPETRRRWVEDQVRASAEDWKTRRGRSSSDRDPFSGLLP